VIGSSDLLDRINVFPVADSDTGKNMSATMWTVLQGLRGCRAVYVGEVAGAVAEAALRGARGNSGVIMAQFFQGLAEGLAGERRVEIRGLARALGQAAARARQALACPQEGTILSAISAFSTRAEELAERLGDFVPVLREGLSAAREAVRRSRDILPALRKAGVVDAGALGFLRFLEGIVHYISTGEVEEVGRVGPSPVSPKAKVKFDPSSISFRYCTECTLKGEGLPAEEIKAALSELGDSVVVAGSPTFLHLHVHTNTPARALELARGFGRTAAERVDDMWAEHAEAFGGPREARIALLVDTSCDLPDHLLTRFRIQIVPLRVRLGDVEYRDRVELTPRAFYERIKGAGASGTSQPPPADFLEAFEKLGRAFQHVVALVLAADLSGTWNAARIAAEGLKGEGIDVEVVDTGTLSAGLGLCTWAAARGAEAGLDPRQVVQLAREAAARVRFWVGLPDLSPLGRSGRVPWVAGWLSGRLRVGFVVSVGQGRIQPVAPAWGVRGLLSRIASLVGESLRGMQRPAVIIPHASATGVAEALAGKITECCHTSELELHIVDASPALGVHAGLGAFGVALLDMGWAERRIEELKGRK
ncbi:DegV family EDD domain-containing protein, partial [Candidatus Bipolaricaulota bacterium]|nr:DegV family EDD domain-containing protein [Candidatus Bipolaricaulota bacterium]